MNINMKNGKVTIDGKTFTGSSVIINGNKVVVDGVSQDGELVGDINVTVHGDVQTIDSGHGSVTALNVGSISTGSGDVKCGDVSGQVRTGSGSVVCKSVAGSVKTGSGSIIHQ